MYTLTIWHLARGSTRDQRGMHALNEKWALTPVEKDGVAYVCCNRSLLPVFPRHAAAIAVAVAPGAGVIPFSDVSLE